MGDWIVTEDEGTNCAKCCRYFIYEELTLDNDSSEDDGEELYYCSDCC
jgi:hypothetical protein